MQLLHYGVFRVTAALMATEKQPEFRRWRLQMGLTQQEAADVLGVSLSQVKNWDAGEDRGRGTPSVPGLAVRYVMAELAKGTELKPWPAEPEKKHRTR